jgi:hypothetical protein
MNNNVVWLTFDLGVQGDYEGLYAWLDTHNARECGDNSAFLKYEFQKSLLSELKRDLTKAFQVNKKTRIYVIYLDQDSQKTKGKFIFGKRKSPPWAGFGSQEEEEEDYG